MFHGILTNISHRSFSPHNSIYIFRKRGDWDVPSEDVVLNSIITKAEWSQWASGIWMIDNVGKMGGHPAIFPDELVNCPINMFSYESDTVLELFLGSGTTIKVSRELNRIGVGYDRESQHESVIMKRLGITEDCPTAESMIGYVNKLITETSVEQAELKAEADVASEFFGLDVEVSEMEPVA